MRRLFERPPERRLLGGPGLALPQGRHLAPPPLAPALTLQELVLVHHALRHHALVTTPSSRPGHALATPRHMPERSSKALNFAFKDEIQKKFKVGKTAGKAKRLG